MATGSPVHGILPDITGVGLLCGIILTERLEKVSNTLGPSPKTAANRYRVGGSWLVDRAVELAPTWQVVHYGNPRASVSDLHRNIERIREGSRFWKGSRHRAHIGAAPGRIYGCPAGLLPARGEITPGCGATRVGFGKGSNGDRLEDCRDGRDRKSTRL